MSNPTTLSMPPLDLADPVRRRHYFQGLATGILGGIVAAFVLPRLFRDAKMHSAAKSGPPADSLSGSSGSTSTPSHTSKFAPPPPASVPFREPFSSNSDILDPVPPMPSPQKSATHQSISTPSSAKPSVASYPDRSYPPYTTEAPTPDLPYGSERTELPLRPDLPTRSARGSNGPANVSLSSNGHAASTNGSSPSAGPIAFDPREN